MIWEGDEDVDDDSDENQTCKTLFLGARIASMITTPRNLISVPTEGSVVVICLASA